MSSQTTLILDGHLDLAYNALFHRRDLTQDINELREREDPRPPGPSHPDSLRERKRQESPAKGTATVSLPEMRRGHVGIALSTIMSRVQMPTGTLDDGARTQLAAHALGQAHLHYYKAARARWPSSLYPLRRGPGRAFTRLVHPKSRNAAWSHPIHGERRSHTRS